MCHLPFALVNWLGGSSRLVAYSFASSGCQQLATSVLTVVIDPKTLEVPDALAILKERNHSVLADFEDASEARCGDGGRSTTAFNVLRVQV